MTTRTIDFPSAFQYPRGGQFDEAMAVTVCASGANAAPTSSILVCCFPIPRHYPSLV